MNSKTIISFTLAILLFLPLVSAASVTRSVTPSVVAPGGTATVTFTVDVSGAQEDFYAIDDMYPSGWTVTNAGEGSIEHSGHWKYIIIQEATNTMLSYTIQAPTQEGTSFFTGEYMFGGMESAVGIHGQDTVTVSSLPIYPIIIVTAVVILSAIVIILFKPKKKR